MTNLQELREIIIKAVYPNWINKDKLIVTVCPSCAGEGEEFNSVTEEMESCLNCDGLAVVDAEKPIYLSEVLIALEKYRRVTIRVEHGECSLFIAEYNSQPALDDFRHLSSFNLTKDLDNQDPETIQSLLKLLKGE